VVIRARRAVQRLRLIVVRLRRRPCDDIPIASGHSSIAEISQWPLRLGSGTAFTNSFDECLLMLRLLKEPLQSQRLPGRAETADIRYVVVVVRGGYIRQFHCGERRCAAMFVSSRCKRVLDGRVRSQVCCAEHCCWRVSASWERG
jgi:hypothetical protein